MTICNNLNLQKFKFLCALLLVSALLCATPFVNAFAAMDLATAKQSGLVGEREDGLVASVLPNPSPDITNLVNTTNAGRMGVYRDTAAKQSIPVTDVQKIAAQKIFNLAAPGEYVQVNGQWKQK